MSPHAQAAIRDQWLDYQMVYLYSDADFGVHIQALEEVVEEENKHKPDPACELAVSRIGVRNPETLCHGGQFSPAVIRWIRSRECVKSVSDVDCDSDSNWRVTSPNVTGPMQSAYSSYSLNGQQLYPLVLLVSCDLVDKGDKFARLKCIVKCHI